MRKEFDLSQFDEYREDNRREVKSKWRATSFSMGNIFFFRQLLWWCYYSWCKRRGRWELANDWFEK